MDAQEAGAVAGGPAVNADKVIDWVFDVMGVMLTTQQKDMIRRYFGEPTVHARTQGQVAGGRRFTKLLVDAYREEMDSREVSPSELMGRELDHADYALRAQGFFWKQEENGYPSVGEAIHEEVARIPDRVFMDDYQRVYNEPFAQGVYDIVMGKQEADHQQRFAATVVETQNTLELLHGHGPAAVEWETDFRETASKGRVYMPFKEGCAVCVGVRQVEKLREDNDG